MIEPRVAVEDVAGRGQAARGREIMVVTREPLRTEGAGQRTLGDPTSTAATDFQSAGRGFDSLAAHGLFVRSRQVTAMRARHCFVDQVDDMQQPVSKGEPLAIVLLGAGVGPGARRASQAF